MTRWCWIVDGELDVVLQEAERALPNETGGILMGYADSAGTPVVTHVIGPGPTARHSRTAFMPDSRWQQRHVDAIYERSGRRHTYLGDWHTHPGGAAFPSLRDLRTLRRIAKFAPARVCSPVMLILGGRATWEGVAWHWRDRRVGPVRLPGWPEALTVSRWTGLTSTKVRIR